MRAAFIIYLNWFVRTSYVIFKCYVCNLIFLWLTLWYVKYLIPSLPLFSSFTFMLLSQFSRPIEWLNPYFNSDLFKFMEIHFLETWLTSNAQRLLQKFPNKSAEIYLRLKIAKRAEQKRRFQTRGTHSTAWPRVRNTRATFVESFRGIATKMAEKDARLRSIPVARF